MTELLCICCPALRSRRDTRPPNRPDNPPVCTWCRQRLSSDLAVIPDAYGHVGIDPVRGTSEIRSRAYESKPPLSIPGLSLLGPGWNTPLSILDFWAVDWAAILDQQPPDPYVTTICLWLTARLDWACDQHPAVDDFAKDVRDLTRELRAFDNTDRGEPVGRCPRQVGDTRCNTRLYVDPYVDEIRCTRCKQTWKRRAGEWMHLRAQQIAAGVEAA